MEAAAEWARDEVNNEADSSIILCPLSTRTGLIPG